MSLETLRLEVLRLVHRHDLTAEAIIDRANLFVDFITDKQSKIKPAAQADDAGQGRKPPDRAKVRPSAPLMDKPETNIF